MAPPRPVKRVLYTISCLTGISTGAGGHYYSMRDMISEMPVDYQIVVIGNFMPSALEGHPNVYFVECDFDSLRGPDFRPLLPDLIKPDIVHAYDLSAALFSARLSYHWQVPFIYTKPGGPPYNKLTPAFDNMIVFHQNDYDNVMGRPFTPKHLSLIPNRVQMETDEAFAPYDPFEGLPEAQYKIITITRIGAAYEEKIRQAVALRAAVAERAGPAVLCVLGKIEHQEVYDRLVTEFDDTPEIRFVTEKAHTYKASRHLPHCDIAIGAGRSFMEALGYGKHVFLPATGGTLPCYAYDKTYAVAFADNFSPRVRDGVEVNSAEAFEVFLDTVQNGDPDSYLDWAAERFTEDHDIRIGAQKTMAAYALADRPESWLSAYGGPVRFAFNGFAKRTLSRLRGG